MSRLALFLLLSMSAPAHAAFLHLCPAAAAPAGALFAAATGPDGTQLRFLVNGTPALPGCRTLDLGAAQVETLHVLGRPARPAATIVLQGDDQDGRLKVSEHTLVPEGGGAQSAVVPEPMPPRTNLLAAMKARSYGVEERVQARLEGGRLHIVCRAGARPAGVLLTGPWTIPRLRATLKAVSSGKGQFAWQAADAAHAAREAALDMGQLPAGGKDGARLALPAGLDRASWRHFVVACPSAGGSLALDSLSLEPEAATPAPRSTWIWDRSAWRERADELLDWATRERIGELFIVVPLEEGRVRGPQALESFVRRAGGHGVKVSAVEGDPHMVLPAQRAATAARARAYAAYNAAVEPAARLTAIQFDIEPYLLPEHVLPAARLDGEYLATVAALRAAAENMPLEFVVPFWWGDRRVLLDGLARHADALSVMDYRTDPGQIYRFAVPFLDWAAANGKRVRIALEAGPLPPETQRRYQRTPGGSAGDMLLFTVGDQQVAVLLRQPLAHPRAVPYRLAGTRRIDGSATTFHADKGALRALLPRLEADFGAWPGFAGIALHELR
jgi:hypothetical protein